MKSRRSIFFFWALFLVPTILISATAFVLLKNEQERINLSAIHTLSQRAGAISDTIHLTVETVQENLEQSLLEMEPGQISLELIRWEASNPLVRNVFVYYSPKKLVYPVQGMASTFEEQQFIVRYDALFKDRIPFDANQFSVQESQSNLSEKPIAQPVQSARKKLIAMSRMAKEEKMVEKTSDTMAPGTQYVGKKGWIPWFNENHLFLLGWVQKFDDGPVYGVELEMVTLLSRLVVDFPPVSEKGVAMVLLDGNGKAMHQTGRKVNVEQEKPVAVVPVSTLLPHWQIAVFLDEKGFGSRSGFLYVSIILLGIFIAAIVSGGILLTRMTLSNIKDAQQKTSFVASVSHELKTPLTSIRMYAELLLSKRIKDEKKAQSYLSVIVSESQRLTRLINNVLDFGKLEQGQKKYHYRQTDISELLAQVIDAHNIRIKDQGLDIITDIVPGKVMLHTDPDALEQVVLNLLDNALKYAGSGKFLRFVLNQDKDSVTIKICDDGPGIPTAHRDLIFNRFHRVDDSLTASQPGSGLGLSIARQILKDMGGDLRMEPMPERGCCFVVHLNNQRTDRKKKYDTD